MSSPSGERKVCPVCNIFIFRFEEQVEIHGYTVHKDCVAYVQKFIREKECQSEVADPDECC